MRYRALHETRYAYESPVFLEPHTVRLRPRDGAGQRLESYALSLDPAPAGVTEALDLEGNVVSHAWFEGTLDSLTVRSAWEVETTRSNPFDFLLLPAGLRPLPWAHDPAWPEALLARGPAPAAGVTRLARRLAATSPLVTDFLSLLVTELYSTIAVEVRETGEPHPPGETLIAGRGSCRDLAVVFVDACRAAGVPARFVSGYQEGDPGQQRRDLHAWAEAFIPGGGWRGFDPTHGLAVSDRHIAVAGAANPRDAAPVAGSYRGSGGHTLSHRIELEVVA